MIVKVVSVGMEFHTEVFKQDAVYKVIQGGHTGAGFAQRLGVSRLSRTHFVIFLIT
jgi:hypothetical protein